MALHKTIIATLLSGALLSACGGGGKDLSGGSSSNSSSTTSTTYSLALSLKTCTDISTLSTCKEQTSASVTLPADKPNLVEATLLDPQNKPVAGAVVDVSTSEYAVGVIQGATRAITDASGVARFVLVADAANGNQVGKVGVTATYTTSSGTSESKTNSKTFTFGALDLSMELTANTTELALNSTATITAKVLSNGVAYTSPLAIAFNSVCATNKKATLDSTATTSNGVAIATYKGTYTADGQTSICGDTDTITATVNGLSKTVSLTNKATAAKTIIAAKPSTDFIFTPASGFTDNATFTFTVTDEYGYPKASQDVDFQLEGVSSTSDDFAKYTLSQSKGTTNSSGEVSVNVKAGAIPSPFRVSASLASDSSVRTTSSQIGVGMGLPDADSFSFAADKYSIEGANIDGETASITMRLADRYNNPVPNGTKVYFTTEGGYITGNLSDSTAGATGYCTTTNGQCAATLTSANPRPADGRISVMAYVVGEESYTDTDGSKTFTVGDVAGDDIDEPYLDTDYDGQFTSGIDVPWDINNDSQHNSADGKYNGVLCSTTAESAGICSPKTVNIYINREFIFSGVTSNIDSSGNGGQGKVIIQQCTDANDASTCANTTGVTIGATSVYLRFKPEYVMYKNGNPIAENPVPSGSTMGITSTNGGTISPCCGPSYTSSYPSTWTNPGWFWFEIKPESTANGKTTGELKISVTSPGGNVLTSGPISVSDAG